MGRRIMKILACNYWFGPGRARLARNIGLILLGLAVAGCPGGKPSSAPPDDGKIIIRGSNTVGEELAPRLIDEYKKDHRTASFDLDSKGTSYGMGALMGGFCDIAGASRLPLKE